MKTPEEVAKGAAERLVTVASASPQDYHRPHDVRIGGWTNRSHDREEYAASEADSIRKHVAPAIAAAIREALARCPVPSPVSDERLAQIRRYHESHLDGGSAARHDLLAHLDFLHRVMDGPEAEAVREAYARGFREGAEAQKEACEEAAHLRSGRLRCDAADVVDAVYAAPLVAPPGAEPAC